MEPQDPTEDLEEEGVPPLEDPPPHMEGTGGDYEAVPPPRDHPVAAFDYGTTEAEELVDEPLSERVRREEQETSRDTDQPVVGRLVEDEDAGGDEYGLATDDRTALSAEEAGMHIIEP